MGHIHAAAMAETDMPLERWEVSYPYSDEFRDVLRNPDWTTNRKYRRKPKVILINGHEVPEPRRTPLKYDEVYWTLDFFRGTVRLRWQDDDIDTSYLKNGFVHLTEEAAEKHYMAVKSFTAQKE